MSPLRWVRVTEGLAFEADIVYRAVTADGYVLEACCLAAFGPYARAIVPGSDDVGLDSVAFGGADAAGTIRNGRRRALRLLAQLRALQGGAS